MIMRMLKIFILLIIYFILFNTHSHAEITLPDSLPRDYHIEDFRLQVTSYNAWWGDSTIIDIRGNGKFEMLRIERDGFIEAFSGSLKRSHVYMFIKELYEIDYFNFADYYPSIWPSVSLRGDSLIGARTSIVDHGSIEVKCTIGMYTKVVRSSSQIPKSLWYFSHKVGKRVREQLKKDQSK